MKSTEYIKTPVVAPLIKRKFAASLTNDIRKLSTFRILMYVYKRHETGVLYTLLGFCSLIAFASNI